MQFILDVHFKNKVDFVVPDFGDSTWVVVMLDSVELTELLAELLESS